MANNASHQIASGEESSEYLRKQLAVAVRSIQWSYAIFWSLSTTQQGILEWRDGYYNGDIKTRKTVQAEDYKAHMIGLQRSEQLRTLYTSLLEGEAEQQQQQQQQQQQAKKPSASLSPEDLSDAEWYYLVCMSFVFNPGQGLPGKALTNGQAIWLCNAQYTDSKVFSRSLLAKSASIQTVVCFPYLGGVIELGVTELVSEDLSLIQHVKASLLELSKPVCSEKSSSVPHKADEDIELICVKADHDISDRLSIENLYSPTHEDMKFDQDAMNGLEMDSVDDCSNGCEHNHQTENSMQEGVDGGAGGSSQVHNWHFVDDDFSNGFQDSMNSNYCISEALINTNNQEKVNHFMEVQNSNHAKLSSLDLGGTNHEDVHYKRTLSKILGISPLVVGKLDFCNLDPKSSFTRWKVVGFNGQRVPVGQQKMLKKILFNVPLMHNGCFPIPSQETKIEDLLLKNGSRFDKLREDEKFLVLRSMVPSVNKIDKASILNNTIKYLKVLEARLQELEASNSDRVNYEPRARTCVDTVEHISDNYENEKIEKNGRKHFVNKRKACDIDAGVELHPNPVVVLNERSSPIDVRVSIKEQEVFIEMNCPYREYILLDVMDAINNLHLDAHTVQSSSLDGLLTLILKSKFRGAAVAPVRMIKQALWKIASRC